MIENQIEHGNEGLNEAGTSFFNGSFGEHLKTLALFQVTVSVGMD